MIIIMDAICRVKFVRVNTLLLTILLKLMCVTLMRIVTTGRIECTVKEIAAANIAGYGSTFMQRYTCILTSDYKFRQLFLTNALSF